MLRKYRLQNTQHRQICNRRNPLHKRISGCAYVFANRRANRMKALIHDGLGIWLCARRLNRGKFQWAERWRGDRLALSPEQLQALVQGLPWQRLGDQGIITLL